MPYTKATREKGRVGGCSPPQGHGAVCPAQPDGEKSELEAGREATGFAGTQLLG